MTRTRTKELYLSFYEALSGSDEADKFLMESKALCAHIEREVFEKVHLDAGYRRVTFEAETRAERVVGSSIGVPVKLKASSYLACSNEPEKFLFQKEMILEGCKYLNIYDTLEVELNAAFDKFETDNFTTHWLHRQKKLGGESYSVIAKIRMDYFTMLLQSDGGSFYEFFRSKPAEHQMKYAFGKFKKDGKRWVFINRDEKILFSIGLGGEIEMG